MLYPQQHTFRQYVDLSGIWAFRPDPEEKGRDRGWVEGFQGGRDIAVPASWNDQLDGMHDYFGDAWYQTGFSLPWGWQERQIFVRLGSVNYLAEVWLNGVRLGRHEGGHLPFEFDITPYVRPEANVLVVRVNAQQTPNRVPPGNVQRDPLDGFMGAEQYPNTHYDFFPYSGIHRPVLLYARPTDAITDLTVTSDISGTSGILRVAIVRTAGEAVTARVTLSGHGANVVETLPMPEETATVTLAVPDAALWSPETPDLYDLTVELARSGAVLDRYMLPVGIRTIAVEGDQLLLNGQPVRLLGFGRHEDFYLSGRGYQPVVAIKDCEIMRWVGANSFRTTHYPYAESILSLADRQGFMVIAETPAVGLYFNEDGLTERVRMWEQQIRELINRDKNHPSVIMWSLANEPHNRRPEARAWFQQMFDLARSLDVSRPVTFVSHLGAEDQAIDLGDVICINRYKGWYSESGQIELGVQRLEAELESLHEQHQRPVLVTEFGTDTIQGMHADPPVMFTEEYQTEFITQYVNLLNRKPYVVGQHVWNLCDFATSQAIHRVGAMNYKGVFTRDRRPKMAAHRLRELWCSKP